MEENGLIDRIAVWLATGLGVGLVSPAPGTAGGLWGLPLALAMGGLEFGGQVFLGSATNHREYGVTFRWTPQF